MWTVGQKTCMHVHGVFPYLFVRYYAAVEPSLSSYLLDFAGGLDKAINIALGSAASTRQHVYKISLVSGMSVSISMLYLFQWLRVECMWCSMIGKDQVNTVYYNNTQITRFLFSWPIFSRVTPRSTNPQNNFCELLWQNFYKTDALPVTQPTATKHWRIYLGTKEIRFGRKTNEIAKFSILDEKTKFTILDEIWTKSATYRRT